MESMYYSVTSYERTHFFTAEIHLPKCFMSNSQAQKTTKCMHYGSKNSLQRFTFSNCTHLQLLALFFINVKSFHPSLATCVIHTCFHFFSTAYHLQITNKMHNSCCMTSWGIQQCIQQLKKKFIGLLNPVVIYAQVKKKYVYVYVLAKCCSLTWVGS